MIKFDFDDVDAVGLTLQKYVLFAEYSPLSPSVNGNLPAVSVEAVALKDINVVRQVVFFVSKEE